MQEWLANPAVQGGVAPFVVTFILALGLSQAGRLNGLSVLGGFIICVLLTTGISFDPLTSTRKIVLIGLLSAVAALLFSFYQPRPKQKNGLLTAIGAGTVLWVIWPVLTRLEMSDAVLQGSGFVAFAIMFVLLANNLGRFGRLRVGAAISATAFAVGAAALFGASASLGQWGIAIGASASALLLSILITRRFESTDLLLTLVPSLLVSLIAVASVVYAKVPWYVLLCFPVSFLIIRYIPFQFKNNWLATAVWFAISFIPGVVAIVLTEQSQGPVLY